MDDITTVSLGREVQRVISAVAHWTPARWRIPGPSGGDRAEAVAALVQSLADLGAQAQGRTLRAVPRLTYDTALPDQLKVVGADLCALEPGEPILTAAMRAVGRCRNVLF